VEEQIMHTIRKQGARVSRAAAAVVTLATLLAASAPSALAQHASRTLSTPIRGGTINYRDINVPTCIDPLVAPTSAEGLADFPTFDNLVLLDGAGHARPDLATSWTFSHGGRWMTFTLRQGVVFSNGDPFDASVVKFNLQRVLGPVGQAAGMSSFLGPLRSVRIDGKYKVTLIFATPFRPALPNLANDSLGIVDPIALKKVGATRFCQYPIGTGPFKIQTYAPGGTQITLVKNPLHTWETPWAHNRGPAYLDKIVIKPIVSDSTAVSELLSGGVDISQVAGSQISRVKGNSSIRQYRVLGQFLVQLGFKTSEAPFDKVEVRRALAEAVDRDGLIKAALNGLGVPAYSPIGSNVPYYDPATKNLAPRYNPSDAQRILSADHVTGPFTLLSSNIPEVTAADELIQAELGNVGVKVKVVSKPTADYISLAQKGNFDLIVDRFYSPDADVLYSTYHSTQETGGGLNFTFYKSAALDKLLVEGRSTFDNKQAAAAYSAAQRFILKNVITDPLWIPVTIFGVRKNVQGFHTDVTGLWPLFQDLYLAH
jgi:peptide/nickel transport system substrate-binding protein